MVICRELGADLRLAQLMPLPLTVSCFSEIQIGFTFLVPATRVVLEKGPLNGCVCVCVRACVCVPCIKYPLPRYSCKCCPHLRYHGFPADYRGNIPTAAV